MEKKNKTRKNPLKIVWIVLGFLCLGLGTVLYFLSCQPFRFTWQRCSALPRVQRNCMTGL